jgi:hypothetical protein
VDNIGSDDRDSLPDANESRAVDKEARKMSERVLGLEAKGKDFSGLKAVLCKRVSRVIELAIAKPSNGKRTENKTKDKKMEAN